MKVIIMKLTSNNNWSPPDSFDYMWTHSMYPYGGGDKKKIATYVGTHRMYPCPYSESQKYLQQIKNLKRTNIRLYLQHES
jgi:hypothetical protein